MTSGDAAVAIEAAEAGAEVVAAAYGKEQVRFAKSATDFATQTDLDAERAIVGMLADRRPDDAREGEEFGRSGSATATRCWLIDPLCGTLNFSASTPLLAVNVALLDGDRALAAASVDPIAQETFWTDGVSAHVRRRGQDHQLRPSSTTGLVEISLDRNSGAPTVSDRLIADATFRAQYGPRVLSSTLAVAWVSAGRRAGYVSDGRLRGDVHFAAGLAIAQAAGCIVTDLTGGPLHQGEGLLISASEQLHADLLRHIARLR